MILPPDRDHRPVDTRVGHPPLCWCEGDLSPISRITVVRSLLWLITSLEMLHQHQVTAPLLVLRIKKPPAIGRDGRAKCGEAAEFRDRCHFSGGKAEKSYRTIVSGRWFRTKVDSVSHYREVQAADRLQNLCRLTAIYRRLP